MGRKTQLDETYLTPRAVYREDVTVADVSPDVNTIPEIRLDIDTSVSTQHGSYGGQKLDAGDRIMQCASSGRAYNGHLELYTWFTPPVTAGDPGVCADAGPMLIDGVLEAIDVRCHATLRVWAWGGEADVDPVVGQLPDPDNLNVEESSSSLSVNFGRWCLVHEQSVVTDTLIVLDNIPANRYRVTVDFLSAGSSVDILEQHTE